MRDLSQMSDEDLLLLRRSLQVMFFEERVYNKELWDRVADELARREEENAVSG